MTKFRKVYRYQLADEYGKAKAKVANESFMDNWGRKQSQFYITKAQDRNFDIITLFEHYQRVVVTYHLVYFNDYLDLYGLKGKPIALKTRSKKEADKLLKQLKVKYIMGGESVEGAEVVKTTEEGIEKYVYTYDKILKHELTDYKTFPFAIFQSYHFKDQIWTLSDVLKSMQLFIDRYIGQIDYSFGKDIKNAYEVVVSQIADGYTIDEAVEKMNKDGILPVNMPNTIKNVRSKGSNTQWMQMISLMQSYMEDLAGGRSFQGLSEGANESGRAVREKRLSGEGLVSLYLDNLSRWKKDLGDKLIERYRQDKAERIIKVGGGELSPQAVQQLTALKLYKPSHEDNKGYVFYTDATHLRDTQVELIVSESIFSETMREKKLGQLMGFAQMNPMVVQTRTFNEMYMMNSDIPYDMRVKLLQELADKEKAQQQAQQQAMQQQAQKDQAELGIKGAEVKIKKQDSDTKRIDVVLDANYNAEVLKNNDSNKQKEKT